MLETIPVLTGWKAGNSLGRPPVHHRADQQTYTTRGHLQFSRAGAPGGGTRGTGRTCTLRTDRSPDNPAGSQTPTFSTVMGQRHTLCHLAECVCAHSHISERPSERLRISTWTSGKRRISIFLHPRFTLRQCRPESALPRGCRAVG